MWLWTCLGNASPVSLNSRHLTNEYAGVWELKKTTARLRALSCCVICTENYEGLFFIIMFIFFCFYFFVENRCKKQVNSRMSVSHTYPCLVTPEKAPIWASNLLVSFLSAGSWFLVYGRNFWCVFLLRCFRYFIIGGSTTNLWNALGYRTMMCVCVQRKFAIKSHSFSDLCCYSKVIPANAIVYSLLTNSSTARV